ncbi:hypothetical protein RJT34_30411 [Clitoria ternatea]|uniref:Uncharacterized protein n=1 Tax=Clitoria ternatea TaxID=43366 RepID=A0AAN9EWY4_CLITE
MVGCPKGKQGLQNRIQFGDLSAKGKSDGPGLDKSYKPVLQVDQCLLTKSGSEVASGKKRKGFEILSNADCMDKIGRIDKSPEVHKSGNSDLQLNLKQTSYMRSEREKLDLVWLLFYVVPIMIQLFSYTSELFNYLADC